MATVTGSDGSPISVKSDTSALAQTLASAIAQQIADGARLVTYSPSSLPPALTGGNTGILVVSNSNTTSPVKVPAGYTSLILNGNVPNTVIANGGQNQRIVGDDGALTVNEGAAGGTGTVVAGNGNNGFNTPTTGGGAYRIEFGTGNDTVNALTGSNTVLAGGGTNTINVGTANNVVNSTGNDLIVASDAGGSDTIGVNAAGTSTTVFGGSASVTFVGGNGGAATVIGGTGSNTVFGANGVLYATAGTRGASVLVAGTGAATLVGGGNGDVLYATGGVGQLLSAGTGNSTLFGGASTGNNTYFAGNNGTLNGQPSQANTIIGLGTGNNTVFAGTGNETVISSTAAANTDIFVFVNGRAGGTNLIAGFNGTDKIALQGYGAGEVARTLASQANAGTSTTLTLSDNTKITLVGVSSLGASSFV